MGITKDSLVGFLTDRLGVDLAGVDDDTPLFSSGLIDSTGMVDLIVYIESEEGFEFSPDDITLENLDSIGRILNFLTRRRTA